MIVGTKVLIPMITLTKIEKTNFGLENLMLFFRIQKGEMYGKSPRL
jgi:hypothetical protein